MNIIPNRAIQHRSRPTPAGDTYTYDRTPTEAADRLLMACDELAALLTEKGT